MTRRFVIRPGVELDIRDGADWYESKVDKALARRFLRAVEQAFVKVMEHPETWPRWEIDPSYQKFLMKHFPFIIFYRVTASQVRVVAVAHAKKKPGYWKQRDR